MMFWRRGVWCLVKVTGQENEKTGFSVLLGLCMLFLCFGDGKSVLGLWIVGSV